MKLSVNKLNLKYILFCFQCVYLFNMTYHGINKRINISQIFSNTMEGNELTRSMWNKPQFSVFCHWKYLKGPFFCDPLMLSNMKFLTCLSFHTTVCTMLISIIEYPIFCFWIISVVWENKIYIKSFVYLNTGYNIL
jgi:hypothetical protein